jgi:hypothetical protein
VGRPAKSISGSSVPPVARLTWSDALGKRVREGDWAEQAVSTYAKVEEAVAAGQWELAPQLVDYSMEEAKVVYVIYQVWTEGFLEWFRKEGVGEEELAAELDRLRSLLAFTDGEPYEPKPRWDALGAAAGLLANRLRGFEIDADAAVAGRARTARRLAPAARPRRRLSTATSTSRSRRCGPTSAAPDARGTSPSRNTTTASSSSSIPAARAAACSGATRSREPPSRAERPYEFGVTRGRYDWAWNEEGVCYYCAHCCFALERWPAEQWGHPIRVVDSPLYPDETTGERPKQCTWTIYKSLEAIPPEADERIGLRKPAT